MVMLHAVATPLDANQPRGCWLTPVHDRPTANLKQHISTSQPPPPPTDRLAAAGTGVRQHHQRVRLLVTPRPTASPTQIQHAAARTHTHQLQYQQLLSVARCSPAPHTSNVTATRLSRACPCYRTVSIPRPTARRSMQGGHHAYPWNCPPHPQPPLASPPTMLVAPVPPVWRLTSQRMLRTPWYSAPLARPPRTCRQHHPTTTTTSCGKQQHERSCRDSSFATTAGTATTKEHRRLQRGRCWH